MGAKDMTASMSLAQLTARDPSSASEHDASPWRPGHGDGAAASDGDDAVASDDDDAVASDDHHEWERADRDRETEPRGRGDDFSSSHQAVATAHSPVDGDGAEAGALERSAKSNSGTGPGQNVEEAPDTSGAAARSQETTAVQATAERRAAAPLAANPASGGADAQGKAGGAAGQANDLATSLAAGKNLKIEVAVAKSGDTLFSQPASSLAATPVGGVQKNGPRPGEITVGASAKAGFISTPSAGQASAAAQPAVPPNAGARAGDLASQTVGQGNSATVAAAQPRSAGTAASPSSGSFADITGLGSTGAAEATQRSGSQAASTPVSTPLSTMAKAALAHPPVAEQISVQISKAVKAGVDRIDIQLRPKELGRIDVRLELTGDGRVSATVTVDNRETLELLKTDARGLEKALDDAGLKADSNTLNFNLRGQDDRPSGNSPSRTEPPGGRTADADADGDGDPMARTLGDYSRGGTSADGRIDIEI